VKILHVETGRHLYGGALQVFYLLRGLHEKRVENLLVCPTGSAIAEAAAPYARVIAMPMRGELDLVFGHRLRRLTRRERPDVLHIHSRRGADLFGSLTARITGQRSILTRRVDNPEPGWLARWKYAPFEKIVTISEGIRRVLLDEGLPAEKVVCIHSAVDIEAWQQPRERDWFCAEFGLDGDVKAVAVIAQLIERKGHRFLVEAMPAILEQVPQARFLFFGQGPLEDALKQLCRENGVADRVIFAGFRDDLARIMPNLDLVVHPALMEGLGVSLLQAAAAGVPIVAGRAGGIPEIVRDGENGFLVNPQEISSLTEAVSRVLCDTGLSRQLGQRATSIAMADFSLEAMVDANLQIYPSPS
jgi:glycosyltransferase involved in cell wall biosynthesis